MIQSPIIYIVTGMPGAGKSSVSNALVRRFPRGLHIPVDDLREWVVSGIAHPIPTWTPETTRQFRLARQAAARTARIYAEAGFAVAIDDVVFPAEAQALFVGPLQGFPVRKILLRPHVETALHRNTTRTNKSFDTSTLTETIAGLDRYMDPGFFGKKGWAVIDSTELSLEETVDRIIALG